MSSNDAITVELQKQVLGSKVIYSKEAVDGRSISIGLDKSKTMDVEFCVNEDGNVEVTISVTDDNGEYQDFAMVRMSSDGAGMDVAIWPDNEDENPVFQTVPFNDGLTAKE